MASAPVDEREQTGPARPRTRRTKPLRRSRGHLLALIVGVIIVGVVSGALFFHWNSGLDAPPSPRLSQSVAGVQLRLEVMPAALGPNRFLVAAQDAHGRAIEGARVRFVLEMRDMGMGQTALAAEPVGAGRYQAVGVLSMPGRWAISVVATGASLPPVGVQATFLLTAAAQAAHPVPTSLPVVGAPGGSSGAQALVRPADVRWPGLPYRAVVSFLGNGLVYLPGQSDLRRVGLLNHSVVLAPGGRTVWVTDYTGGRVVVLDPRTGGLVGSIAVGLGPVHIAFAPDGLRAYVSDFLSNDIAVVDVRTRRLLATTPVGLHPHGLAITPDGRQVWVPCGGAGGLWVVDTRSNRVSATYPAGLQPHAVVVAPDGRTVYMTDAGAGDLVVLDRAGGRVRARLPIHTGSAMVAVSPDGQRVYVSGQSGNVVTVVDTATRRIVARVPVGGAPHGLALTPDGRLLYVAANDGWQVAVVATATGRVVATVPVPGPADELALWR